MDSHRETNVHVYSHRMARRLVILSALCCICSGQLPQGLPGYNGNHFFHHKNRAQGPSVRYTTTTAGLPFNPAYDGSHQQMMRVVFSADPSIVWPYRLEPQSGGSCLNRCGGSSRAAESLTSYTNTGQGTQLPLAGAWHSAEHGWPINGWPWIHHGSGWGAYTPNSNWQARLTASPAQPPALLACQCDDECLQLGDCCDDYLSVCKQVHTPDNSQSCVGRCGQIKPAPGSEPHSGFFEGRANALWNWRASHQQWSQGTYSLFESTVSSACFCDKGCLIHSDCCTDYVEVCVS